MKSILLFFSFAFLSISYGQDISGSWFQADSDLNTPFGYAFHEDGSLVVYKIDPNSNRAYDVISGSYYFEEGSNLLVTITWYGSEAITSKYQFTYEQGELTLTETYPNKSSLVLSRNLDIADL